MAQLAPRISQSASHPVHHDRARMNLGDCRFEVPILGTELMILHAELIQ